MNLFVVVETVDAVFFPQIWVPSPETRDLRQLLWHRLRLVQMRTRIMNQFQAPAMNEGCRWKKRAVQRTGTSAVREARGGSLGQSAPASVAGVARTYGFEPQCRGQV